MVLFKFILFYAVIFKMKQKKNVIKKVIFDKKYFILNIKKKKKYTSIHILENNKVLYSKFIFKKINKISAKKLIFKKYKKKYDYYFLYKKRKVYLRKIYKKMFLKFKVIIKMSKANNFKLIATYKKLYNKNKIFKKKINRVKSKKKFLFLNYKFLKYINSYLYESKNLLINNSIFIKSHSIVNDKLKKKVKK